MQTPEDVAQMLRLRTAGLGIKHIAREIGCSKNTVRRYVRGGGWAPPAPARQVLLPDACLPSELRCTDAFVPVSR